MNWWRLAVIGSTVLVASGLIAWRLPDWHIPMWAALVFAFVLVGAVAHPMFDGTYHLWVADEAEGWTASELRKLKRAGWGVVGRVPFEYDDVDHVAVRGTEVFAIDTKYTDSDLDLASSWDRHIVEQWAGKADRASRTLRSLLRHSHRLDVKVVPLVAVWGMQVTGEPIVIDGVIVLKAGQLRNELRRHESGGGSTTDIQARVVAELEDFRRMRSNHQRAAKRGVRRFSGD